MRPIRPINLPRNRADEHRSEWYRGPIKLLVIVGPTSSGKSELAVRLAKCFNGEIINADSRQIYKGMDLGTGKIPGQWISSKLDGRQILRIYVYKRIRHHLIDIINPKRQFSAALFQQAAKKIIANVSLRGKLPILCGGTGQWIDTVVHNLPMPYIKPNPKLRARLGKKSADDLYRQLKKLDPRRAKNIDKFNKRRLIRALEIVISSGKPVPLLPVIPTEAEGSLDQNLSDSSARTHSLGMTKYNALWLGIKPPQADLYKKIDRRLKQRLKAGMVNEVRRLHTGFPSPGVGRDKGRGRTASLSWRRLESFGLEYKFVSQFLQKYPSYSLPWKGRRVREGWNEMVQKLSFAIKHYSKRQLTWWKRNKDIVWIKPGVSKAIKLTKHFLSA